MANSGSFKTTGYSTNYGNAHLVFSWSIESQDPATNKTVINWDLKGAGLNSGHYIKAGGFKVAINGQTVYSQSTDYRIELYTDTVVASGTATITHDTDGTKSFSASAEAGIYTYGVNCSGGDSWDLTPIPRYANFTKLTYSYITETSVRVNWDADAFVDQVAYTLNDSGWVYPDKALTFEIEGLSPNTRYSIKMAIKRQDSQLWTYSEYDYFTTYNYPYCIEAPAFTIGEPISLGFYNPLGREFTFYIVANGIEIANNWTISGTSYYGLGAESTKNQLYATIPDDPNSTYSVITVCNGYRINYTNPNSIYSIDPSECAPIFNDFNYRDSNNDVSKVTGNDQIIVKGLSRISVEIPVTSKMVPKNSATADYYKASIEASSTHIQYSDTEDVGGELTVLSAGSKRLSVTAYDSRGLETLLSKDITVYDYSRPVVNVDIKRLNNYEEQTTLKVSGSYSSLIIDGVDKNALQSVQYRYRETGGTWSGWATMKTTVISGKFTCNDVILELDKAKAFEVQIKATDNLSNSARQETVDIGQALFFISTNKRKCYVDNNELLTYDTAFPIGSIVCLPPSEDPNEKYGGYWLEHDRAFTQDVKKVTQTATEYLSGFEVTSVRSGTTIRLIIKATTSKELNESSITLGKINLAEHGLQDDGNGFFPQNIYGGVSMSDGGNAVILVYLLSDGTLQTVDCFQSNGTHTLPVGSAFYFDVVLPVYWTQMQTSYCQRIYWERIS